MKGKWNALVLDNPQFHTKEKESMVLKGYL